MSDEIRVESPDFATLSADVRRLPREAAPHLRAAMEVTGTKVRDTARENASGMAHAPAFPWAITYDFVGIAAGGGGLGAFVGGGGAYDMELEIGPDKDRPQGALGNLIEYGSVKNPPQGIMHGALQANEADLEVGIQKATDEALKAVGL